MDLLAPLRERLLSLDSEPAQPGRGEQPAAVLVPLFVPAGSSALADVRVVLTRRRADLRRHAGEISFPGGRPEAADGSLAATALREAHEEIGLPPAAVTLLGTLPAVSTFVTGYLIHPFVATIPAGLAWVLSVNEVDEVLELSLADLTAGAGRGEIERRGLRLTTDTYTVDGNVVWGATQRIVTDLLERWQAALRWSS
ncbi:MAG TPA: CoA pyrophosphatase [Solirubrobacteraceae bacterium]|nr:CoA pyrophosphatase [Solirubrobacteraceae bacterium]